jgi:hypothetical protein
LPASPFSEAKTDDKRRFIFQFNFQPCARLGLLASRERNAGKDARAPTF